MTGPFSSAACSTTFGIQSMVFSKRLADHGPLQSHD